ncbi:MAG: PD-(D/E)XK nuclease family protein [Arcobacter sp.]|nr:MAG: PD-(D/E)XK nuclease family protein [Arcobacter sp.]
MQSKSDLLVFPTSRSIREFINSQKEFNTLLPSIITIDELFKKSLLFENKKLIDEEERFLYLKEAVTDVNLKALGISSNFLQFIKQSDYIYRFFLELSSESVDIETLTTNDTYDFYSEHLEILKIIRNNYLNILDKNMAVDKINMSHFYKINNDFLNRYSNIELNFEGYFTSFEFEVIKHISNITNLELKFIYNNYNRKSIEKFINYGFNLEINNSYKINFTNKKILRKEVLEKKSQDIEIKGFSSRTNQIAFIKKSISELVINGVEPSKIALILPEETFASTLSIYDKEAYFNYAMGLNIYTSNLYKIMDAIYLYMNEDEIKNIENLYFLHCDKVFIDDLFKVNWNKNLTKEVFEKICEYLISIEDNEELVEKFKELLYRLYKLIFSFKEKILLKDAYKILHQKISKISLDDVNSGKITVMGLLESRMINFDAVIICDFNENLIPKRSIKDKFLSTSLKEKVNLPTKLDRENLQKYYYERLISNSKHIFISYVKNDSQQISRFANILFDIRIDENLHDNSYKHILYGNKKLEHFNEFIEEDIDLSKIIWSASSLKEYLECKRKYYLNHILKIKEHDISIKPKGYELGNIVHNTLEEYYKQDIHSYNKLLELFNTKRSKNTFLNLDLEIWKRKFEEFVQKEDERFSNGYKIIDLEKPFLIEFENIKLRGTIDRIDIFEKNIEKEYFVIDYKTSNNLKINTKKTFETAVDFQLEFYYLAVEELYKTSNIKTFYYDLHNMKLLEEVVLDEKLELLKEIFSSLKTTRVAFNKCENNQICQYCNYKTICNR